MIWWAERPRRAIDERSSIANLEEKSSWLTNVSWQVGDDLRLLVKFNMVCSDGIKPFTMTYPNFFPNLPPQIRPEEKIRLSSHQYGAGGELCLEYRPDNWNPEITGTMMIESAYRLLMMESAPLDQQTQVLDAHRVSISQQVRSDGFRFMQSEGLPVSLQTVQELVPMEMKTEEYFYAKHWLTRIVRIGPEENPVLMEIEHNGTAHQRSGYLIKVPAGLGIPVKPTYDFLTELNAKMNAEEISQKIVRSSVEVPILIAFGNSLKFMSLASGEGNRQVYNYTTVMIPPKQERLSTDHAVLAKKSVAVIGCGSVGSKVASSLARSGIGKFVLVDGDIFLPGNLVRNELDIRSIGLNKPDAMKARILEINPSASVETRKVLLGGQESSIATESALNAIAECDLIVDATADPQIYNLCAAVVAAEKKGFLWGEIFSGGIGGLFMLLRPEKDPTPYRARTQLVSWCADRGVPWTGKADGYDIASDNAPPMIADDSDVMVISAHMSRMAIDFLARQESIFPNSAYAVGLKSEWIFQAPFDTWPIDLITEGTWGKEQDANLVADRQALFTELFPGFGKAATNGD